jgi:hypothetical protein
MLLSGINTNGPRFAAQGTLDLPPLLPHGAFIQSDTLRPYAKAEQNCGLQNCFLTVCRAISAFVYGFFKMLCCCCCVEESRKKLPIEPSEQSRKELISNYIETNFNIIYKSDLVDNIEDAEEFLICEKHDNLQVIKANALFIEKFKTENSVAFIEGSKSLVAIPENEIDSVLEFLYLTNNDDISFFGWDNEDTHAIYLTICEVKKRHETYSRLSQIAYQQKDMTTYFMLLRKCLGCCVFLDSLMRAPHPARTADMINTLRGIKKLRVTHGFTGKIFLIAGATHLEEPELWNASGTLPSEKPKPSEFSLSTFYEELKTRKVIVLKSKLMEKYKYLEPPYEEFEECSRYSSRELFIDLKQIKQSLNCT